MSSKFKCKTIQTTPMPNPDPRFSISHRQELLSAFDQSKLPPARVGMAGTGGLGSWVALGLSRVGVGHIDIYEPDVCEPTNLHRQLFFAQDVFKPKAHRILKNLSPHCIGATQLRGFAHRFEDLLAAGFKPEVDVMFVGVDNNAARRAASEYCYRNRIPLVNVAVDAQAEQAHVMIQESDGPCLACMNPGYLRDRVAPCFVPSCIDCLFAADGFALFAITSLILGRPRAWNFRNIHLAGFVSDAPKLIERNPHCPVCSKF